MRILLVIAGFLVAPEAMAFPEMVRHGYTNCVTCHTSPSGGGMLTEYGRAIGKEVLSHGSWFFEKGMDLRKPLENQDEQPLGGALALPKGLSLGGDVRALQLVVDNKQRSMGRFILMQADLELAWYDGKRFLVDATIGRSEPAKKAEFANDYLISRRHWLLIKMGPPEELEIFQLRFGRFFPAYGINIAEHNYYTRKLNGFDQAQESYNAEFSFLAGEWSGSATGIFGRPDKENRSKETGGALQLSRSLGGVHRVGVNYFQGKDSTRGDRAVRSIAGVFGLLGWGPKWYTLAEVNATNDKVQKTGVNNFVKVGYEPWQGVHFFLTQQYAVPSFERKAAWLDSYTFGLQYFPRVHWDFLLSAGRERNTSVSPDFSTVLMFLAHYYL